MYDNRNTGTLFVNNKRTKDTHPNYQGKINIDGVEYYLSGWIKESKKDGSKFFSLSVKPVSDSAGKQTVSNAINKAKPVDDFDQEIPF